MKPGVLLTVLIAAPVAVVSALVASMLFAPAAPTAGRRPAAAEPVLDAHESDLRVTLETQERELELLRERIALLESRPAAAQRLPLQDPRDSIESAGSDAVAAHAMTAAPAVDGLSGAFVANVDVALQQIREQERQEEVAQRYARQLERIDQRLERLTERIGLSPYQVDEMRGVLRKQEARETELRALREEIDDRDQYREARRALEAQTQAALTTILTPEQMEGYERSGGRGNDGNGGGDTQRRGRGNDRGQRNG